MIAKWGLAATCLPPREQLRLSRRAGPAAVPCSVVISLDLQRPPPLPPMAAGAAMDLAAESDAAAESITLSMAGGRSRSAPQRREECSGSLDCPRHGPWSVREMMDAAGLPTTPAPALGWFDG